jgi:hypothetical protein
LLSHLNIYVRLEKNLDDCVYCVHEHSTYTFFQMCLSLACLADMYGGSCGGSHSTYTLHQLGLVFGLGSGRSLQGSYTSSQNGGVMLGVIVTLGVRDGVTVMDGVTVSDGVTLGVVVMLGVLLGVSVGVIVALGVSVGVIVTLGDTVMLGVLLGVSVGVTLMLGVVLGVGLGDSATCDMSHIVACVGPKKSSEPSLITNSPINSSNMVLNWI